MKPSLRPISLAAALVAVACGRDPEPVQAGVEFSVLGAETCGEARAELQVCLTGHEHGDQLCKETVLGGAGPSDGGTPPENRSLTFSTPEDQLKWQEYDVDTALRPRETVDGGATTDPSCEVKNAPSSVSVVPGVTIQRPIELGPKAPPHPQYPADPLLDDPADPDATPEVREPGGALDPNQPFCKATVRVRAGDADGLLLNRMDVTVGDETKLTGECVRDNADCHAGEAWFNELSCVTPHTVVIRDEDGRPPQYGVQVTTVEFDPSESSKVVPVVLQEVRDSWGNGIGPELTVGQTFTIPWLPCFDGTCGAESVSYASEDPTVLTVAAQEDGMAVVTAIAAGTAMVTATRGGRSVRIQFTVVAE